MVAIRSEGRGRSNEWAIDGTCHWITLHRRDINIALQYPGVCRSARTPPSACLVEPRSSVVVHLGSDRVPLGTLFSIWGRWFCSLLRRLFFLSCPPKTGQSCAVHALPRRPLCVFVYAAHTIVLVPCTGYQGSLYVSVGEFEVFRSFIIMYLPALYYYCIVVSSGYHTASTTENNCINQRTSRSLNARIGKYLSCKKSRVPVTTTLTTTLLQLAPSLRTPWAKKKSKQGNKALSIS